MPISSYIVDAFTTGDNDTFTGNPAAVCLLEYDDDVSDAGKQNIASEFNLSETAFVALGWTKGNKLSNPIGSDVERRTLRWFTRKHEVPLCGHATLASSKVLQTVQLQGQGKKTISFESKFVGKLGADISDKDGYIKLDFPANPTHSINVPDYAWMNEMLEKSIGQNFQEIVQDIQYSPGTKILLLRLKDAVGEKGLLQICPDFKGLLEIETGGFIIDIIVTVKGQAVGEGDGKPNFYSRFFGPWDGIDEDPVTGLAHTVLTPYWTKELGKEVGTLWARQSSQRGGDVRCTLVGDRVKLAGQARIVLKGELSV